MAAPNLKTPTTITGKSQPYACTATLALALANASNSGKVFKVNVIRVANLTSSGASVDVSLYRGTTHSYLIKGGSVPSNGSLLVMDRNEYIYLEEGDALYAKANAATTVDLTIHYEEIA